MAGESTAFPVTGDTTALYYFQGDSLAVSAGVDSGPNSLDLSVLTLAPGYGRDGYYADAAIEAGDDGVEFYVTSQSRALQNTAASVGATVFPDSGWQLEMLVYVHEWDGSDPRFSGIFEGYLSAANDYIRIYHDENNTKFQLDWKIGGARAIHRDGTADNNWLNTWVVVIVAYVEDATPRIRYKIGRAGTDATPADIPLDFGSTQNMPDLTGSSKLTFGFDTTSVWYGDYEKSTFHVKSLASMPSSADLNTRYTNIVAGIGVAGGGGPLIGGTLIGGRTGQLIGG